MTKIILHLICIVFIALPLHAQKECSTVEYNRFLLSKNPALATATATFERKMAWQLSKGRSQLILDLTDQYTIPVVFHIVYKNDYDSFSESILKIQLARLNEDYNNLNSDQYKVPPAFTNRIGKMNLKFVLAKTDPNGNPTNGYEYKKTNKEYNESLPNNITDDFMKYDYLEGLKAWDAHIYLNIWVCKLKDGLNGFATWPANLASNPELDGVVINTTAFSIHPGTNPNTNYGRTLCHEVGHWLDLRHIWADDESEIDKCAEDDQVDDTPKQGAPNYGNPPIAGFPYFGLYAPNHIEKSCNNGTAGDMWMNYMDYTPNLNRIMFTQGQVIRARAVFSAIRSDIINSNKHLPPIHENLSIPAFTSNDFTSIAVGKNRIMWAGTNRQGLYKFDGTNWAISNGALDGYRINHILADKNGGIWIAQQGSLAGGAYAAGGGVHYYPDGSVFTGRRYFSDAVASGLPSRSARSLFIDTAFTSSEPRVWVSTMNQLDPPDDNPKRGGIGLGLSAATPNFLSITPGLDGSVINSGTYTVGGNNEQIFVFAPANFGKSQIVVYNASSGSLITSFDNSNTGGVLTTNFFARAIYADFNKNKWVGMDVGGIALANSNNQWQSINYPNIFPTDSSVNNNAIAGDRNGNVFIGTTAGLVMYNGTGINSANAFRLFTMADGLPSNNVTALVVDSILRKIVIATDNGITYWDKDCLMNSCEPKVPAIASTTKNGNWSDPTVWNNGVVPDCNTIVVVYHTLVIDPNEAVCHSLFPVKGSNTTILNKVQITGGEGCQ